MFENSKIKRAIKKHRKPNKSFNEFCEKNGIQSDSNNSIKQGDTKVKGNVFGLSMGIISACICIVAVIAILLLMPNNKPSQLPEIKYYGVDMVKEDKIGYEEFVATDIPTLIDFSKVEQYGVITMAVPVDGENLVLGYNVNDILYGFWKNEQLYAFRLILTIRCYETYLFSGYDNFNDPMFQYNTECHYSIFDHNMSANISIKNGKYEYFITVKEYEGITPVNKENIELLIQDIL